MGKIALWILALVGALELTEVIVGLSLGWPVFEGPMASNPIRGRAATSLFAFVGIAICGGIAVARWARSKLDWFTWRVGW